MIISGSSNGAYASVQACVGHKPNLHLSAVRATSSQYSAVPVLPATAIGSGSFFVKTGNNVPNGSSIAASLVPVRTASTVLGFTILYWPVGSQYPTSQL